MYKATLTLLVTRPDYRISSSLKNSRKTENRLCYDTSIIRIQKNFHFYFNHDIRILLFLSQHGVPEFDFSLQNSISIMKNRGDSGAF